MKLMVKTDKCVELLKEIQLGLCLYCFNIHCSDKFAGIIKEADNKGEAIRQYYKDKSGKDRFLTDEEAIQSVFDKDDIFCRLAFLKALTFYVLSPMVKIADKHQQLEYVKVCTVRDPYADVILDTVESFGEPIYVKDLEDEFMEVCPDMDSIGKYLSLALSKYDEVKLPCRKKRYSMDDLVFGDNGYSRHIRKAESIGLITKEEAETILVSIWQVIDRANTIFDWIAGMYAKIESLIPSNGSYNANVQAAPDAQSAHFSVDLTYIGKIYNHISEDVIPNTVTNTMFLNCVSAADFSAIWGLKGVKKAKLKYTIFVLKEKMPDEWYKLAANSIDSTPQKCSGASVPVGWDTDIRQIK